MADNLSDIDAAFGGGTGGGAPPSAGAGGMADIDAAFAKGTSSSAGPSVAKDMAAQIPAGLVAGTTALAGTPGDLQAMNNSIWDRLSSHAVHGLLYMAGQIKTPEDEANFKKMMGALSSDGSGIADQTVRAGVTQANLPDAVGAALTANSLPTGQQTLDSAKAVPGISYITPDPQTGPGRYTRAAVSMFPAMFAGGEPLLAGGAVQAGKRVLTEAVAPGVGAEAAQSATDDPTLKPLYGLLGGMAGGAAPHVAGKTMSTIAETAPVAGALDKVGISGPAQTRAAKQFIDTATNPAAVRDALANPANPTGDAGTQFASISAPNSEGVPTFAQPTTPELTQDPGLLIAQRKDMKNNPQAYLPRIAANNDTRLAAMQSDPGANSMDVADHVQNVLSAIHDDAQAKVDQTRNAAAASLQQAQDAGQQHIATATDATQAAIAKAQDDAATASAQAQDAAQNRIAFTDQATQAAIDDARARQAAATAPIQGTAPETLGENLRAPLSAINGEAKAREGALHQAIDPNGTLVASTAPIAAAAKKAYGGLSETAKGFMSPAEGTFTSLIDNYGPNISYREGADLSSNLAAAMRQERMQNGQTPAYNRMTQLMSGVKSALNDTVRQKLSDDSEAVAAGQMAPEDTMEARLRADADRFLANRTVGLAVGGEGSGNGARAGSTAFVGVPRAASQSSRGSGGASSNTRVSPETLGDPDPDVANRIAAANAATRERKQTYERGTVGDVLRPGQVAGEFRISDAQVPAKVFRPGPQGGDAARGYLRAAKGDPQAVAALHATATNELSKVVEKNDGILTQGGLSYFKRRYGDALRALDEHTPGFSSRFDDIPQATEAVERAVGDRREALRAAQQETAQSIRATDQAGRVSVRTAESEAGATMRAAQQHAKQLASDADQAGKQSIAAATAEGTRASKDYQQGIVGNLISAQNPEAVVAHFKTMLFSEKNGVAEANRIAEALKGNPDAEAGMRKAAAQAFSEHVTGSQKLVGGEKGLIKASSGDLYKKALPVLSRLFPEEHVAHITKVLADAERAEKAFTGSKLPGGSNTAQDSAGGHGGAHSLTLGHLAFYEILAEHAGSVVKKVPYGAQALAVGGFALRALRNMGITSTQKYFREALRNPEFAAQMVKRVSPTYDARQNRITGLVRKALIRGSRPDDDDGTPPSPSGGAPNPSPPSGPFSRGGEPGSRERAIPVTAPGDIEPARSRVDTAATPAQAEAGNYRKGHVTIDGMPISIENPKGSVRSGVGKDGTPWQVEMPADYGYFKGTRGADKDHIDTFIGERPSNGVAHIIDQLDPDTKRFDEHKVVLNAGDTFGARSLYGRSFSDGRGEDRIGGVTALPVQRLRDWLSTAKPRRPFATSRFAQDPATRIEPTWHPDSDATYRALSAHDRRLNGMVSQLGPDASVKDISDTARRASDEVLAMVRAYHGTPHEVTRFDSSRIGSGEGNQAYGHGLYFAEHQGVAQGYRDTLSLRDADLRLANQKLKRGDLLPDRQDAFDHIIDAGGDIDHAIKEAHDASSAKLSQGDHASADYWMRRATTLSDMKALGFAKGGSGNLYKVAIDREPEHFLDWDAPLNEQSPHVQDALRKMGFNTNRTGYGMNVHQNLAGKHGAVGAAQALNDAGIAGIRYLDQGSRGANASPAGTRNYVVFNDKDIAITHRNGNAVSDELREEVMPDKRMISPGWQPPPPPGIRDDDTHLSVYNDHTGARVQADHVESLADTLARTSVADDKSADPLARANASALGHRLSQIAGDTPVYRVGGPNNVETLLRGRSRYASSAEGFFDHNQRHIILHDFPDKPAAARSQLALHEGVHAALFKIIDESDNARALIDHLRQSAIGHGSSVAEHYGLSNAHEFMSEALTNPDFQRHLASIPADPRMIRAFGLQGTPRTMWDAVVGAMRKILGLAPDQHTHLDAAMKLGGHLLDMAEERRPARSPSSTPAGAPPSMPPIGAIQEASPFVSRLSALMGG